MELKQLVRWELGSKAGKETYIELFQPEVIDGELRIPFEFMSVEGKLRASSIPLDVERLSQKINLVTISDG